ncbi:hypothetical protein HF072_00540 [Bacillus sp. RO3]|nr:hypothetical protein [Bacillus sp. RO3]
MTAVKFEIYDGQIEKFLKKLKGLPGNVEEVINGILHKQGIDIATAEITRFMPVSGANKKHAKKSNWSKSTKGNLEFTIKARGGAANKRGSFGYLVFPNEGRGPHNPLEQRFMERGAKSATSPILNKLNKAVDERLRKELI